MKVYLLSARFKQLNYMSAAHTICKVVGARVLQSLFYIQNTHAHRMTIFGICSCSYINCLSAVVNTHQ